MSARTLYSVALGFFIVISSGGLTARAADCLPEDVIQNSFLVTLKKESTALSAQKASTDAVSGLKAKGFKVGTLFSAAPAMKAAFTAQQADLVPPTTLSVHTFQSSDVDVLRNDPRVQLVEQNCRNHLFATPNDPKFSSQWALQKIHAPEAWDISTGDVKTIIAISDTGIDYLHEDLQANMWVNEKEKNGIPGVDDDGNGCIDDLYGCDFANNDGDPMANSAAVEHGTHVAGIAGGVGNNGIGISGISQKVRIIAAKGFTDAGAGDEDALVQTIYYSAKMGARVINCSWGRQGTATQALIDAVKFANSQGAMVVAAAGNNTVDASGFTPANVPGVVTIAATDSHDAIATFSNYGSRIDLAAPGGHGWVGNQQVDGILSTLPRAVGGYGEMMGTSMAAPYVTGLAGLVLSAYPSLSAQDVLKVMKDGGDSITVSTAGGTFTYKRINAFGALKAAQALVASRGGNNGGDPNSGLPKCQAGDVSCDSGSANDPIPVNLRKGLLNSGGGMGCGAIALQGGGDHSDGPGANGSAVLGFALLFPLLLAILKRKRGRDAF